MRGLLGSSPVTVLNYTSSKLRKQLELLLRQQRFDSIQMEGTPLAAYLPVLRNQGRGVAVVCDWHNIDSEVMLRYSQHAPDLLRRLYAKRTASQLQKVERQLARQCDAHTMVSERDRSALLHWHPAADAFVIENGVDVEQFAPTFPVSTTDNPSPDRSDVVFVGSMDYHANIDAVLYFVRQVWPQVRSANPRLHFTIVGSNPTAEIRQLAVPGSIQVTGTVDDVRPYYTRAVAAVVPLQIGGGSRLKILEAMAAGVPVVSTTLGAEGLAVTPGLDIVLADTPGAMAAAILEVAAATERQQALARHGRRLVEQRYDWRAIGESLFQIHQRAAAHKFHAD
ncbi:MAG TPA: glycosyltransferase [Terriglobales bacterium]|nr:glycosyltransferase [Terriglobales bacterium]